MKYLQFCTGCIFCRFPAIVALKFCIIEVFLSFCVSSILPVLVKSEFYRKDSLKVPQVVYISGARAESIHI